MLYASMDESIGKFIAELRGVRGGGSLRHAAGEHIFALAFLLPLLLLVMR